MDLSRHYTHWNVKPYVREHAQETATRFRTSWNTYYDHPPGYALDAVSVDFWDEGGRGYELDEHTGDAVVAWLLGQHVLVPIQWLIWFGHIWTPEAGWLVYNGWQGSHHDHVHVTFL